MAIRHYLAFLQRLISNVARILYKLFNKDNITLESKVKTSCERPINWTMSYEDRRICMDSLFTIVLLFHNILVSTNFYIHLGFIYVFDSATIKNVKPLLL